MNIDTFLSLPKITLEDDFLFFLITKNTLLKWNQWKLFWGLLPEFVVWSIFSWKILFFSTFCDAEDFKSSCLKISANDKRPGIKLHVGNNLTKENLEQFWCTAGSDRLLKEARFKAMGTSSQPGFLHGKAASSELWPRPALCTLLHTKTTRTSYRRAGVFCTPAFPSAGTSSEWYCL